MRLEQQYSELGHLKDRIDAILAQEMDFGRIRELYLYLSKDLVYQKLKVKDSQLNMLDDFLNIWLEELHKSMGQGWEEGIFSQVRSLKELERKYQRARNCALRIENQVPDMYIDEAIGWLLEEKFSGMAIGRIVMAETRDKKNNLLRIAQELKHAGDLLNATLLLQYANVCFPGHKGLLLEEADCWLQARQWKKVYEILTQIEEPGAEIGEMIDELEQVMAND